MRRVSHAHAMLASTLLMVGAVLATLSTPAHAQDDAIPTIGSSLTGTWESVDPIREDGPTMLMSITPIEIEGLDNAMYVESVLSTAPWDPFRQAIFQLYEYRGKVRLRTYEILLSDQAKGVFDGMGAAPDHFPALGADQLIATLDVELTTNASGFSGSTPYPYPTGIGGAVEMTSSVVFDGTTLTTSDRGYDAQGEVVWGDAGDSAYEFRKADPYAVRADREDDLVIIDYPSTVTDVVPQDGDEMSVHYEGFLRDATLFDASYTRGMPYTFRFPPGNRAIAGWGMGMEGFSEGARRKFVIPSDLAYGERGNPRASIGPDEPLYFNAHNTEVTTPEPAPQPVESPETNGSDPDGASSGSGAND